MPTEDDLLEPEDDLLDLPVPFGVFADSGRVLDGLDQAIFDAFQEREQKREGSAEFDALMAKADASQDHLGVTNEVNHANDLAEVGWAVMLSSSVTPEIREALDPLLKLRSKQAGDLFKVFEGERAFGAGDKGAAGWLRRFKINLHEEVDPSLGVPYYILIVAPPGEVPFEFQYELDLQWAVGRIWFPTVEAFRNYAESVARYENDPEVPTSRQIAVFSPEHDSDRATQMFTRYVARPLLDPAKPFGARQDFRIEGFLGADATRDNLQRIWTGSTGSGRPSLVFSGSHGMVFPPGHAEQASRQGAILCQDWKNCDDLRDAYYAAEDLPADAQVHGLVHFFFACYSAGWPQWDQYRQLENSQVPVAPEPMLARLPQALLSHPKGGALAVIGHVERAWATSFRSSRVTQITGFRSVMAGILKGDRLGNATDHFNQRWAILTDALARLHRQAYLSPTPVELTDKLGMELTNQWVVRDDARNYVVFGDPAVRLRVEKMAGP